MDPLIVVRIHASEPQNLGTSEPRNLGAWNPGTPENCASWFVMTAPKAACRDCPSLVVTLGPASLDLVSALARAGADAFRLNGSHMSATNVRRALERIRSETRAPVVVDLQGAKIRLGTFAPKPLFKGASVVLGLASNGTDIPLPHAEVFCGAKPGDTLSCDDDRIRLRIESVSAERLIATSLNDGTLMPRKGVNVVEHPVVLEDLSQHDAMQIEAALFEGVSFACSFMRDGREASWIRVRAPNTKVVGKIERKEAIEGVEAIASCVDALWICRGDLGAQVGFAAMARWVSLFQPTTLPVPVLIAGQVFEHLTHHASPTRSEVCHLYDLLQRGYAGVVLSDETAIGVDPVRATETVSGLLSALK